MTMRGHSTLWHTSWVCPLLRSRLRGTVVVPSRASRPWFSPWRLARPLLCALSALRGTLGGATMTTPVGRAQHHAPVCSKATRARRTGFYHGSELPRCPFTGLRPFALPHPKYLRTLPAHPLF